METQIVEFYKVDKCQWCNDKAPSLVLANAHLVGEPRSSIDPHMVVCAQCKPVVCKARSLATVLSYDVESYRFACLVRSIESELLRLHSLGLNGTGFGARLMQVQYISHMLSDAYAIVPDFASDVTTLFGFSTRLGALTERVVTDRAKWHPSTPSW